MMSKSPGKRDVSDSGLIVLEFLPILITSSRISEMGIYTYLIRTKIFTNASITHSTINPTNILFHCMFVSLVKAYYNGFNCMLVFDGVDFCR